MKRALLIHSFAFVVTMTADAVDYVKDIKPLFRERCVSCHGAQVQFKNVRLDQPEAVKLHAQNIHHQVVVLQQMPMNNATGITDEERALIGQWFQQGAAVR